jgi:gas vesicle protein
MTNDNFEDRPSDCRVSARNIGQKLVFLMIGGGIGAAVALLFAPKRGSELREDISTLAAKSRDESIAAANRLKVRSAELCEVTKEAGSEVMDVVAAGAHAVQEEFKRDAGQIGSIVERTAKRAVGSANPSN